MDFESGEDYRDTHIKINNYLPKIGQDEALKIIVEGLSRPKKRISSMFFYDSVGSRLFEEITHLPEYYPTVTEKEILKGAALHIQDKLKDIDIVEIGSGDSTKISIILDSIPKHHLDSIRYIPIDVSQSAIEDSANILLSNFAELEIHGVVADFLKQIDLIPEGEERVFCFFGSTLGNLGRAEGKQFIADLGKVMRSGDILLLGLDMAKDKNVLEQAYNDSQNITASFNLNILNVVNSIAETDFDSDAFEHVAFYNNEKIRVEMHLKAKADMVVSSPQLEKDIHINEGEMIHTENSHKFKKEHIEELAETSQLKVEDIFNDDKKWFSLVQLTKE